MRGTHRGWILAGSLALILSSQSTFAQETLPVPPGEQPREFDPIIQKMKFDKPTRIAGRLRSLDGYEDAIWIDWTHVHDGTRWREVRNEIMFKVLPRDPGMMDFFRALKLGATLHMTVQMDQDGNRRVLELEGT
jgi:hypothetical protein